MDSLNSGEECRSVPEAARVSASSVSVSIPEVSDTSGVEVEAAAPPKAASDALFPDDAVSGKILSTEAEADSGWREELSARLIRYRARRRPNPPRYPSLCLPLQANRDSKYNEPSGGESEARPAFETLSHQALALDRFADVEPSTADLNGTNAVTECVGNDQNQGATAQAAEAKIAAAEARLSGAKIIEFPRFASVGPPVPLDELAEPVIDRPRILEVPEVTPPPPALGGITIGAAKREETKRRPGIDFPLQDALLGRRVAAAAIDGLIIALAGALFGFVFWKVAAFRPPLTQMLAMAAGTSSLLWAAYQYLLIVYSGSTPGLRLARLELTRFDDSGTTRRIRRWRVLASYLSAVSLGMGYVWVFLDEDSLCWHDRITRTYFAPRKPRLNASETSTRP